MNEVNLGDRTKEDLLCRAPEWLSIHRNSASIAKFGQKQMQIMQDKVGAETGEQTKNKFRPLTPIWLPLMTGPPTSVTYMFPA